MTRDKIVKNDVESHGIHSTMKSILLFAAFLSSASASEPAPDLKSSGWQTLGEKDFRKINCPADTWQWKEGGSLHCTGAPVGVLSSVKEYKNFEMSISWCHLKDAGNSGVFLFAPATALGALTEPGLPGAGIEVQIVDLGYTASYEKSTGKKADWFTCHGDVFPVGTSKMKPFPPLSPNGVRSFPSKNLSKGVGEWNHYLIRAMDGVVRLWVNGEQVSGGENCDPAAGFICLESEGSPIDFKDIKVREITQ